jgi:hypothetical protein
MITHLDFRRSFRRYILRSIARILTVFAMGALVFLILWLLLELFDQRDDPTTRAEAAMAVAIIVGLVAAGLSARAAVREARADRDLVCTHCDSTLASYYGILVLHSGNCPHCGEQVLDD